MAKKKRPSWYYAWRARKEAERKYGSSKAEKTIPEKPEPLPPDTFGKNHLGRGCSDT
jgi:hypothetical protein